MAEKKLTTREREAKVLELRIKGLSFDEIAKKVGYQNRGSAKKAYDRALHGSLDHQMSDADWRRTELHRIDILQAGLWPKASRGDLGAVREVSRLMLLRSRIQGYSIAAGRSSSSSGSDGDSRDAVVIGPDRLDEMRERRARDAAERAAGS